MQHVALMINVVLARDVQAIHKHHKHLCFSNDLLLQVPPAALPNVTVTKDMTPAAPLTGSESCHKILTSSCVAHCF